MEVELPNTITEQLAEETGIHIGDGSMNFYKNRGLYSLRGHVKDDFDHYKTRIIPLFKEIYNANVSFRIWPDVCGFQICSTDLVNFKNKLGLPLGPKGDIIIPNEIFKDDNLAICCLRGIFDTDGNVYIETKRGKPYPRIHIYTTSGPLAKQICLLIKRLGFTSLGYWVTEYKHNNWKPLHRICVRGWPNVRKWFELIQPKNPKHIVKVKNLLSEEEI